MLFQYTLPNSSPVYIAISAISGIVAVLGLVGFILFLIAMHGFSKDYGENRIFDYILYGLIIAIVAGVIALVIGFFVIFSNLASIIPSLTSTPPATAQITSTVLKSILPLTPAFAVVGLIWVAFNVRAFNLLADKSTVPLFRTGAKVLLAGAVLSIVISVVFALIGPSLSLSYSTLLALFIPGGLVQDVAWALLAMAYFRIKPPAPQAVSAQPPFQVAAPASAPAVSGQVKYCPHFGTPNQTDAVYCTRCGQKL
jgi:uncharacterized membrane protein